MAFTLLKVYYLVNRKSKKKLCIVTSTNQSPRSMSNTIFISCQVIIRFTKHFFFEHQAGLFLVVEFNE